MAVLKGIKMKKIIEKIIEESLKELLTESVSDETEDLFVGKYCIVRTYSAGVHFGTVKSYDRQTKEVVLTEARRLYYWEGAFTLSAVSQDGVHPTKCKISRHVPVISITAIEVIPCSLSAASQLKEYKTHE
jgi:hypothetical protein